MIAWLVDLLRTIHPAPAAAVTALSGVLGAVLLNQAGLPVGERWALTVLAVAGSQVFTGVTNDLADLSRDAVIRPEKPLPAGRVGASAALWLAAAGLAVQLAASLPLGLPMLLVGVAATASALTYNVALSRTVASALPYLVSFALLPAWVALGVGIPVERVLPAVPLIAPFAVAAHLANTLRDFHADASLGAGNLAQRLGRRLTQRLAFGLALGPGLAAGLGMAIGGRLDAASAGLGALGLAAIAAGWRNTDRLWNGILVAAVAWTAAWALVSG